MAGKKQETPTSDTIQFYCRMRFLKLDEPVAFEEGQDPRWEGTFILDLADPKGQQGIAKILQTAAKLSKETYGVVPLEIKKLAAKFIPGTKKVDLNDPANAQDDIKVPFQDGDAEKFREYKGYAGMFIVPSHNKKLRPRVANRKGVTVQPGEPQYPYDGCYGYGSITLWLQVGQTQAKYGRRIGVNLRGAQFAHDGERFTQDEVGEDEFQALEDSEPVTTDSSDFD